MNEITKPAGWMRDYCWSNYFENHEKNTHEKQKQTLKNWLIEGYRNNNNKIIQKSKRT